ncbi:hypothetical protein O1B53_003052 [Vibrio cholerae]|nr:hypothetical protein [Vibrio cholerae]
MQRFSIEEVGRKHKIGLRLCGVSFVLAILSTISYLKSWIPQDIGMHVTVICMVFALVVAPIVDHLITKYK